MSFRAKLSLIFVLAVIGSVCVVAYGVTRYTHAEIKPHIEAYRAAIRSATPSPCERADSQAIR